MNDRKFLALLNLYLDGEIDPAGAAELEREIHSSPVRRRAYTEYCRIHRATQLVYENFRAAATDLQPAAGNGIKHHRNETVPTAAFERRTGGRARWRPFRVAIAWTGGFAAACLAIALVAKFATAPAAPQPQLVATPAPTLTAAPAPVAIVETPPAAATFAAPFSAAADLRADPYVTARPEAQQPNPFTLVSWPDELAAEPPATTLAPPTANVSLQISQGLQPASSGFDPARPDDRTNGAGVFRQLTESGKPTTVVEPKRLEIQR